MSEQSEKQTFLDEWEFPYRDLLGFEITHLAPDRCRIELPAQNKHKNRHGVVHGGVFAGVLDTAMGISGCFTPEGAPKILPMTLSLTANFLSGTTEGICVIDARCTGGGRNIYFAQAEARTSDGTVIATATGTFKRRFSRVSTS